MFFSLPVDMLLTCVCGQDELCNLKEVDNNLAIFCMATYGEGDPTDNAQEFYEWLQGGDGELEGLNYAVSDCEGFVCLLVA